MGLTRLAVRRPITILMIILMIVIMGIRAFTILQVDRMPKVDFPFVTVVTVFPGASPTDIEDLIVKPIEDAVAGVSGVDTITAQAGDGVGVVALQFKDTVNADKAAIDVERQVQTVRTKLPTEALDPTIIKADINATPIMQLALSGPQGQDSLYVYARDNIKPLLQAVPGVATVNIGGGRQREVLVNADPARLAAYGLGLSAVQGTLNANNMTFPVGVVEAGRQRTSVRSVGNFTALAEIQNLVVSNSASTQPGQDTGGTVYLKDVAQVQEGYEDRARFLRLNGQETVGISIIKASDGNTIEVADRLRQAIDQVNRNLPPGARITTVIDDSKFTRASVNGVRDDLILAIIITGLVMLVFLHTLRSTFIVLLAIPTSIIATFLVMWMMGFSLNTLTMMALTLVIGILVDDSIVVIENIQRHLEMGKPPVLAALDGRSEIGLAAITITLVDVVVYLPVAFTSGIIGQFFRSYGLTIVAATLFSLIISFTLTPMLASQWLRPEGEQPEPPRGLRRVIHILFLPISWLWGRFTYFWEYGFRGLANAYARLIRLALHNAWTQALVLLIAAGALAAGLYMVGSGMVGSEFYPQEDDGQFQVSIEMPPGTSLAATDRAARQVEDIIRSEVPEVAMVLADVGSSSSTLTGDTTTPNLATITARLVDKKDRRRSTTQIVEPLRRNLARVPGATVSAKLTSALAMSSGAPIQIQVTGPDANVLIDLANQVAAAARGTRGTIDVLNTDAARTTETRLTVDRGRAADLGLSSAQVVGTLRTALSGSQAGKYSPPNQTEIPIVLRVDPAARQSVEQMRALPVSYSSGKRINLGQVVQVSDSQAPARITRTNRQRYLNVRSNVNGRPSGDVTNDVEAAIKARVKFPAGYAFKFSGATQQQRQSFGDMGSALLLSIALIYILLVALYQNFLHPLAIMFSLPVTLVGAFGGLWLTGRSLNIISILGIVLLTGVVTKNAILIVDFANQQRQEHGLARKDALAEAGRLRLRPILMTTAAIIFALLPLLLSTGAGSETRAPMAAVVIGGNITSTLLSLVLVPVMYNILDGFGSRMGRLTRSAAGSKRAGPAGPAGSQPVQAGAHAVDGDGATA